MNWKPHVINEGSLYITYKPQLYKSPTLSGSVCVNNVTLCLNDVPKFITATVESFVKC